MSRANRGLRSRAVKRLKRFLPCAAGPGPPRRAFFAYWGGDPRAAAPSKSGVPSTRDFRVLGWKPGFGLLGRKAAIDQRSHSCSFASIRGQSPSAILPFVAFKRSKKIYDENSLYDYAVGALGRRMRTVAELKRLMRQRVEKDEIGHLLVEMVILRLKEQKYLNDTNYAAAYSAFRRDNEKFGRRRVITDLKVKGVHPDILEKEVDDAYSAVNEENLARAFLKRKRLKKPANQREAARVFRALMRAGFAMSTAVTLLKNCRVDDELLTALQEEET